MKKRRIITIDEAMNMSTTEFLEFCENDEKLLAEGIGDVNESNTDFMGMTTEELIQKYHLIPLEEALDRLRKKLGK